MYTDPGSGLFFVQVLIAALFTAIYRFRGNVAAIFVRSNRTDRDPR
jgi:hypothetical protein